MPIHDDELDEALRTPGRSWKYLAKVLESIREARAGPAPPSYVPAAAKLTRKGEEIRLALAAADPDMFKRAR